MKTLLVILAILPEVWTVAEMVLTDKQREKPLPEEVADIYDAERWETFRRYKKDNRLSFLIGELCGLLIRLFFLLSPFYHLLERCSGNMYILTLLAYFGEEILEMVYRIPLAYYQTFTIMQRYGLNKATKAEFRKDQIVSFVFENALMIPFSLGICFLVKHIPLWTNMLHAGAALAIGVTAAVTAVFLLFMVIASFAAWFAMRKEYTFKEMEDSPLKRKILALASDAKKKVQKIEVYDESKKTTRKNAFLLKLLWIRRFGIADNFLNENDERELLAVLSHEIGHLKHRKNIWNYLNWGIMLVIPVLLCAVLMHGDPVLRFTEQLKKAYDLQIMNPVLLETAVTLIMTPVLSLIGVYRTNVTRAEEYEADRNAVKNGYGEELIRTFRTLSSDELVDVNPHPVVEFLTYDHPGMYNRIKAIHSEMEKQNGR